MRHDNVSTSTPTPHTIPSPLPPAQKSLALYHLRSMSLPISRGRQQHSILLSPMGLGSIRLTSQFCRLTSEWYHAPVSNFYMKTAKDGWGLDTGHTDLLLSLLSWVSCRHANFSLIDVIVGLSQTQEGEHAYTTREKNTLGLCTKVGARVWVKFISLLPRYTLRSRDDHDTHSTRISPH
jgi:hypothetical protein